ncbi:uncharacterized protein BO80DRAFT_428353 [Aspergillus ibericus CBS 121593]|uniref:Uncharacterized protein n=1 Tax=Aspergillus ibericus CBS 121593 TaxID=1448316 RepID=A0A395GQG0_9EURO|nr:hypothetical protein BO80DRAFT_428353 [Aspergillus ibericus CBS 121593]RAK97178.1 hypothetical protein BO80DRAFT_428353 [Aspergillus ibericus CBS 121593]
MNDFLLPRQDDNERNVQEQARRPRKRALVLSQGRTAAEKGQVWFGYYFFAAKTPSCRALGMGNVKRLSRPTPWRARVGTVGEGNEVPLGGKGE